MSVLDQEQFDFISIHKEGYVVLSISDHLEWDEEGEHLFMLQSKINNYLDGIESGQLVTQYPDAEGKQILIQIIAKFRPNKKGYEFLRLANKTLQSAGYRMNIGFINNGELEIEEIE
ncbi:DUF6572 domain-containing protein [Lacibacter sp. H375]|uniref:DUF6572 domain-containing protein n=1 Tax=Lacibacter sp. H375 TaxID=3133424 RepID=UPI0030BD657D